MLLNNKYQRDVVSLEISKDQLKGLVPYCENVLTTSAALI